MKRDMDLIRLQLMRVEGEEPEPDLSAYPEQQKVYHMALLIEAGLVLGGVINNEIGFPTVTSAVRLTWAGHEFLDASRNETTWQKVTKKMKGSGYSLSFEVVKTLLVEFTKDQFKPH